MGGAAEHPKPGKMSMRPGAVKGWRFGFDHGQPAGARARAGRASQRRARWRVRRGAALIQYGLIPQWAGAQRRYKLGEAGDDGGCACLGEGIGLAELVGVADAVEAGAGLLFGHAWEDWD
jgi:hypothetical protein